MKVVQMPSGAELKITVAPFSEAKALYQAVAEEAKALKLDPKQEIDVNFFKDIFCVGLASAKIEKALEPCLKRVTYNGLKIDANTFEDVEARQDYFLVCYEVAKENLLPFTKSLTQKLSHIIPMIKGDLV
jgi:maltooligosyltrehalose synthase